MITRLCRNGVVALVACSMLAVTPAALASGYVDDRPSFMAMFADGLLVRPLGLAGLVVGSATWLVTLPFSALGGNVGEATQKLVVEPAEFTFTRPLGEL